MAPKKRPDVSVILGEAVLTRLQKISDKTRGAVSRHRLIRNSILSKLLELESMNVAQLLDFASKESNSCSKCSKAGVSVELVSGSGSEMTMLCPEHISEVPEDVMVDLKDPKSAHLMLRPVEALKGHMAMSSHRSTLVERVLATMDPKVLKKFQIGPWQNNPLPSDPEFKEVFMEAYEKYRTANGPRPQGIKS